MQEKSEITDPVLIELNNINVTLLEIRDLLKNSSLENTDNVKKVTRWVNSLRDK